MACKIADDSSAIQPVVWATIPRLPSRPGAPAAWTPPRNAKALEVAASAQSEQARQAEIAQARQAAFEDGVRKGRADAAAEIKNANDRLANTLRDLLVLKRRMRTEAEADVVKLSLAIGRRILHRELNADPESIQGIVYAGLQKLQNREISGVRVSPAALDPVRVALEKAGLSSATRIIPDPKLQTGEIFFETVFGELDASVETQLLEIQRGFADRLGLPS